MRRFPVLAAYVATFGSMTVAALVVIALLILDDSGGGDSGRRGSGNGMAIVVAAQDIPAGTTVTEEMLTVVYTLAELVVVDAFSNAQSVVGQQTRIAIAAGEQLTPSKLGPAVRATSGPPISYTGLRGRAVSLNVEPTTTDGALVFPGDRVDILIEGDGGASATTVVDNVVVLAVGRTVPWGTPTQQTITVMVAPEQAQLLSESAILRLRRSG